VIFLVGECTGRRVPMIQAAGWGRMWIARGRNIYTYPGEPWGFDNGAYRDWVAGDAFNESAYLKSLNKALTHHTPPYLAVLPDIPGDGAASWRFSWEWYTRLGPVLPWYLAVQDGMTFNDAAKFMGRVEGIFLGGTDRFKSQADKWCAWAHDLGLRFHYGRCGTQQKLAHALRIGADSADSTLVMWKHERWALAQEIVRNGPLQTEMDLWE